MFFYEDYRSNDFQYCSVNFYADPHDWFRSKHDCEQNHRISANWAASTT